MSDTDRRVAAVYDAGRPEGDPYAAYSKRISYLIDPEGIVRKAYEVDDPAGHAEVVLADLKDL